MEKVPDSLGERAGLCTYIEVNCKFAEGFLLAGDVTYRFYIGNDNITNFDVRRNTIISIYLYLTDDGLNKVSWKVEADVTVRTDMQADGLMKGDTLWATFI